MGTPRPERSIRSRAFTANPHFGVELLGSIQLVRDDLDVVDPLEHDHLPNFVDRDPRYRSRSRIRPPIPLGSFFSVSHKIAATGAALSAEEVRSVQIETSRPISTTASTGSLKYSVRWAELRCMKANSASTNRGKAFSSSPGTTVSWPT